MPEKPEKKVRGIPPQFPIPIGVPSLVSQAIFEHSLGSFFAFYLLSSQSTFFFDQ